MPYDGSAIAIFSDPLDNTVEVSLKEATPGFKHADEIEGVKDAVFQRTNEQDMWALHVVFPQKDVVVVARFPISSEPEGTAGLHIRYRDLQPGVVQISYDLSQSQPFEWFLLLLMTSLRHRVYH